MTQTHRFSASVLTGGYSILRRPRPGR